MSARETRILMGMPITLEVVDRGATQAVIDEVFDYLVYIDEKFSTYKETSEIAMINSGALAIEEASLDMRSVFQLAGEMKTRTGGYFDIQRGKAIDPSGLVKGWAVSNAAGLIRQRGFANYYVEAGGDSQAVGKNREGQAWRVGIRNPFDLREIVKVLAISDRGVATSGNYVRGQHIYNPHEPGAIFDEIVSLTVIGPDVTDADCLATAAFAMGREGIQFIENEPDYEGYSIDVNRQAIFTSGFSRYVQHD
jgi:FAD:protein FMN transferase